MLFLIYEVPKIPNCLLTNTYYLTQLSTYFMTRQHNTTYYLIPITYHLIPHLTIFGRGRVIPLENNP